MPLDNNEGETTPLLRPTTPPAVGPKRLNGISRATLIVPVFLVARFSVHLPVTTTVQIIEIITCQLWYKNNHPIGSELPPDACSAGPVKQSFAAAMTFLGIIEAVGTVISLTTSGYLAARYGRKPVMLAYFGLYIMGVFALLIAQEFDGPIVYPLLIIWLILHSLTDLLPLELISNMYVVDVVDPEERTAFLSKLAGWGILALSR
ncbi:hypothetical protein M422DRAFT_776796 [Sphaerobolus stellatus SS14]|nr:hypothetical protein M422DRAFT_776796 [Sphaerobolus stellatus SS14]